jgi:hypothetical protein
MPTTFIMGIGVMKTLFFASGIALLWTTPPAFADSCLPVLSGANGWNGSVSLAMSTLNKNGVASFANIPMKYVRRPPNLGAGLNS